MIRVCLQGDQQMKKRILLATVLALAVPGAGFADHDDVSPLLGCLSDNDRGGILPYDLVDEPFWYRHVDGGLNWQVKDPLFDRGGAKRVLILRNTECRAFFPVC